MKGLFLLLISLLEPYKSQNTASKTSPDSSIIITRIQYNSHGMVGYGGQLVIRNKETNQLYSSQSKRGLNPFIVIRNVPPETYSIVQFAIITGPNKLIIHNPTVFNEIVVNNASIYFLGNYSTKKIRPLLKYVILISHVQDVGDKIIHDRINDKSEKMIDLKINYHIKLFKQDSTIIEINNNR